MPRLPAWLVRPRGISKNKGEIVIHFKGKEFPLKSLFIRQEAALAKQLMRLRDEDLEVKADAMIEIVRIQTGIDVGDLNAGTLEEIRATFGEIMAERAAARESADGASAEARSEAQAEGKAGAVG
jgi:hypothetical protein